MKKATAKVFKTHSDGKIKVIKNYRAASMQKGETTTAIKTSKHDLFQTLGKIMLKGSKDEIKLVANTLESFKEDPTEESGMYIKY